MGLRACILLQVIALYASQKMVNGSGGSSMCLMAASHAVG